MLFEKFQRSKIGRARSNIKQKHNNETSKEYF